MNNAEMERIFDESREDAPMASEELRKAYRNLCDAFQEYLNEYAMYEFCYGYELGLKEGKSPCTK